MRNLVPQAIWEAYPDHFRDATRECLSGAGGFSGACLWRLTIQTPQKPAQFCLRRWPKEHPDEARLRLIHNVLRHAANRGIDFIPGPISTLRGETFLRHDWHWWELTPWMPGEADYFPQRSPAKLKAAMAALAKFHVAVADFSPRHEPLVSPGIDSRLRQLRDFIARREELAQAIRLDRSELELSALAWEILALFQQLAPRVQQSLASASNWKTSLQPAIRDIWSDHVLFAGDRVTGIVDFGSLNFESPAADVARLLGSFSEDDEASWDLGLQAYESVLPLSGIERQLVRVFDESTVAMSGLFWLQWIYLDGRQFEQPERILERLRGTLARMRHRIGKP